MEGLGAPVRINPYSADGIDPTLDECCRREVSFRHTTLLVHFLSLVSLFTELFIIIL